MGSRVQAQKRPAAVAAGESRAEVTSRPLDMAGLGLILLSTLLAASQAVAVKFGLDGFTPFTLIATRAVLATLILLAVVWRLKLPFPSEWRPWLGAIVVGTFQVAVAGCLHFSALQYTSVGRATLITSTQPFLMVLAAHFLIRGDRLTWRKVAGLVLGFAGVLLVVVGRGGDLTGGGLLVDLSLVLAASLWAGSQILVKFIAPQWHMMSLVTAQIAAAAFWTTIAAFFFEPGRTAILTPQSTGGLLYLATIGTAGMFFLMFYTIHRYEVSTVSSFIFLQPVFAVVLGAQLLGEQVTWNLVFSMCLVALGLVLVNRVPKRERAAPARP